MFFRMKKLKIYGVFGLLFTALIVTGQDTRKVATDFMPVPQKIRISSGRYNLTSQFSIAIQGNPNSRIFPETNRFLNRLANKTGIFFDQNFIESTTKETNGSLTISVERPGEVRFGEDETYTLIITSSGININATTDIGALHGLETLLQALKADNKGYFFPAMEIEDAPRFPWRGLMIDAARHFQPVGVIKRNIDGMAAVKLNVLHLHLSDDQGFRVESKRFPKLIEKGSDGYYFTQEQIKDIVKYADQKGIRVYPEFDVPGHATAILTAYPEFASQKGPYSIERKAGVFDPTLDPTNPETYTFLSSLFEEMSSLFKDEYFHIGGDENEGKQWDKNDDIQKFMKKHKFEDNHDLQAYFNQKLLDIFNDLNKKMIGWDEIIHKDLPKTAIIQSWRGLKAMEKAAKSGYKTILSNGFYIDLLQPAYQHYLVEPLPDSAKLTSQERENMIGGEATMWAELVTTYSIDSRIWPRTAVIAERLWSPKEIRDVDDMYRRMNIESLRLEQLGLEHLTSPDLILRNIAGSTDIESLKVLTGVCHPLRGYRRNPGGTMYTSYSPYLLFADACIADPPDALVFNKLVKEYFNGERENVKEINKYLSLWASNHSSFIKIADGAPVLNEIFQLSANLSSLANYGKEAMKYIETSQRPGKNWIEDSKAVVAQAKQQGGRTQLDVVDSIELLINATVK